MSIRNSKAFVDSLWDWSCLDGCFGDSKISVTDIDGFVERNGQFLVIEGKGFGVPIPKGQEITFQRMVESGLFTVIIVWGKPLKPQKIRVLNQHFDRTYDDASMFRLRDTVRQWFEHVNLVNG